MAIDIDAALNYLVERDGWDLHLKVGSPPVARVHGDLWALKGADTLKPEDTEAVLEHISRHSQGTLKEFTENGEADFAYQLQGVSRQALVATYKQASFLDYVYFTQLETSDPVAYGFPNPSAALTGANFQCSKFRREGRDTAPIPNSGGINCTRIVFVSGDAIDGSLHTNDDLLICGSPSFGRSSADVIEVSAPPTGWSSGCGGGANPNFVGPFATNAPVLTPPPTNGELRTIAGPPATYTGQTAINLSGSTMTVTNGGSTSGPLPIPSNGVVYVANGVGCSSNYSPFTATTRPAPAAATRWSGAPATRAR